MGNQGATPPPCPPQSPKLTRGPRGRRPPTPPGGRWDSLSSPGQDRGVREVGRSRARLHAPSRVLPQEPRLTSKPAPAHKGATRTAPGDSKRARTAAVWGPRPLWPQRRQRHPLCCLHREGRGTDRRQVTPRPTGPTGCTVGGNGAQAAPPPPSPSPGAGTPETRRPSPRRAHSRKPGRGETGMGRPSPPQAGQAEHGTVAGNDEGHGPRGTALPAPGTGIARNARAISTRGGGEGANAARARRHTHTKDTQGVPEGQLDRARGTQRPHGMAYQRARIRETQTGRPSTHSAGKAGREVGNGEDTTPGSGPDRPEPAANAAHTQPGHCTRGGSSGAARHAPAPRLGNLRASPRGSHW